MSVELETWYNIYMLSLEEMLLRLLIAVVLGAIIGLERESVGKEAGIRTDIMVTVGASIFSMVGLALPYIIATSPNHLDEVLARNSGFLSAIGNVVVGIGFIGAGIIIHQGLHVRGLTTAATVWFAASVGVLVGIGLTSFAIVAALLMTALLWLLRKFDLYRFFKKTAREGPDD